MDLTPIEGVASLLPIFFMITASFTSEKVIEAPPLLPDQVYRVSHAAVVATVEPGREKGFDRFQVTSIQVTSFRVTKVEEFD